MIFEALIHILFTFIGGILSLLPSIDLNFDSSVISTATQFVRVSAYIIPFDDVFTILSIITTLQAWRVLVSLLKTIWDIIPLL